MVVSLGTNAQRMMPQSFNQFNSNSYNSNQYKQQQPRSVSQSVPLQYQHLQQQQQHLQQLHSHNLNNNAQSQQSAINAEESPMGSFGMPSAPVLTAAAPPKQGWRARQQEQQEQAALQQQQLVQYEMMKLQMFQQAQYFAQAQAQMALLSIDNSQVNSAGHVVSVGPISHAPQINKIADGPYANPRLAAAAYRRASPTLMQGDDNARGLDTGRTAAAAKMALSANASAFKPGSGSRSATPGYSGPPSPTSDHDLPITPEVDLPQFIGRETVTRFENKAIAAMSTTSFPIRQPLGPPVPEVKDLGSLNFLCRNRRQIGGRLGGLMGLAMGRQAILAH